LLVSEPCSSGSLPTPRILLLEVLGVFGERTNRCLLQLKGFRTSETKCAETGISGSPERSPSQRGRMQDKLSQSKRPPSPELHAHGRIDASSVAEDVYATHMTSNISRLIAQQTLFVFNTSRRKFKERKLSFATLSNFRNAKYLSQRSLPP